MGYANAQLIQALSSAIKQGREEDVSILKTRVRKSQESCPHPLEDGVSTYLKEDSPTHSQYVAGGTVAWCHRCSLNLGYAPSTNRPGPEFLRDLKARRDAREVIEESKDLSLYELETALINLDTVGNLGLALNMEVQALRDSLKALCADRVAKL